MGVVVVGGSAGGGGGGGCDGKGKGDGGQGGGGVLRSFCWSRTGFFNLFFEPWHIFYIKNDPMAHHQPHVFWPNNDSTVS